MIEVFETLPSTQSVARARAAAGAPEGTAILALQQSEGKGRGHRVWSSPPGNLAVSVVLRPKTPLRHAPQYALRAAVALGEALARHAPALRFKWPNDIMLNGAKLAGILAEAEADAHGNIAHLILGIGANLAHAPPLPDRPTACLPPPPPAPEDIARAFIGALRPIPFSEIRTAWLARGPALGEILTLRDGTTGAFAGIAEDGALLLSSGRFTAAELI